MFILNTFLFFNLILILLKIPVYLSILILFFFFDSSVSLIAFTTMALLTIMEFSVYQDTWMKYEYEVDKDFSR